MENTIGNLPTSYQLSMTYEEQVEEILHKCQEILDNTNEIINNYNIIVEEYNTIISEFNEINEKINTNTTNIGTLSSLTTTEKTNLVGAINEVDSDLSNYLPLSGGNITGDITLTNSTYLKGKDTNNNEMYLIRAFGDRNCIGDSTKETRIWSNVTPTINVGGSVKTLATTEDTGTLSSLTTTEKSNLVSAINEVDSNTDTNTTNIGTLSNLNTTEKTNLVGAINEVNANTEKNIILVGLTNSYSYDGSSGEVLIPINTEINKVGTKFTLDTTNNKVKIGSNINYVLVSFNVNIYDSSPSTTNNYNKIAIFKNGTAVSKSSMRTDSKINRQLINMANLLIPVQENDEITFKVYSNDSSATFNIESNDTTFTIIGLK